MTYTYNFDDQKYQDYVCILSVLAQVAIDSAKRRFDIDLTDEISHIKNDMNVKENGYPAFWTIIRKGFNKERVNLDLKCPMNYIFEIKTKRFRSNEKTIPMNKFFVKYELEEQRRKSKKVEELIQKYSLKLYNYNIDHDDDNFNDYLLLRNDFDELIEDIRSIYISKNYLGLMSWLINRAFNIGSGIKSKQDVLQSTINMNKSILIKTLYEVNPESLLKCFSGNINKK